AAQRGGEPDEIVGAALYLASDLSSYTTGSILTVDGVNCGEITVNDEVSIVRNHFDHQVIRKPSANFFTLLRDKLRFGERS
ncbi:MAG: SDR family oxidoreductase, partial [Bdellovibrionota bacterium]